MFTGIIQEIGHVRRVETHNGKILTVSSSVMLDQLKTGDSISINGACQTATHIDKDSFTFYSSPETLSLTNLNQLKVGDPVNLERPLSLNDLLDGHLVQGHADGTGVIQKLQRGQEAIDIHISCPKDLLKYMIHKGSIAVDGVSLTINQLYENNFLLTVIPITFEKTVFQYRKVGDSVNIEVDLFAKYVEKLLMGSKSEGRLTKNFLSEHGFIR